MIRCKFQLINIFILSLVFTSCEFGNKSTKKVYEGKLGEARPDNPTSPVPRPTPPGEVPDVPTTPEPPTELPLCSEICEKESSIISSNLEGFSYLGFANFGYRGIGRCRGHALLTQKMSILAKFESKGGCDLMDADCLSDLYQGIDKILRFETHTFNGFDSLYEFSSNPAVMSYLRQYVQSVSHRYTASGVLIKDGQHNDRRLNVFYELAKRSELGHLPYVGVIGPLTGSHALLITKTEYLDGGKILCVRDPNIVFGYAEDCSNYVFVGDDYKVYYKRYDRNPDLLSKFELTNDEDRRVRIYTNKLHKQCIAKSLAAGECKVL